MQKTLDLFQNELLNQNEKEKEYIIIIKNLKEEIEKYKLNEINFGVWNDPVSRALAKYQKKVSTKISDISTDVDNGGNLDNLIGSIKTLRAKSKEYIEWYNYNPHAEYGRTGGDGRGGGLYPQRAAGRFDPGAEGRGAGHVQRQHLSGLWQKLELSTCLRGAGGAAPAVRPVQPGHIGADCGRGWPAWHQT